MSISLPEKTENPMQRAYCNKMANDVDLLYTKSLKKVKGRKNTGKERKFFMQEKSTDDLRQELMERPDLDTYLKENQASFVQDEHYRPAGRLFRAGEPVQGGPGPEGGYERGISSSGIFRTAQALPGPAALPVRGHGSQPGGDPADAQAGCLRPPCTPSSGGTPL